MARYERPEIDYTRAATWRAMRQNGLGITTVLADTADNARAIIRYELDKNPSRWAYLAQWQADGELVEVVS